MSCAPCFVVWVALQCVFPIPIRWIQECKENTETKENKMLYCDSCDAAVHCACLDPPLTKVGRLRGSSLLHSVLIWSKRIHAQMMLIRPVPQVPKGDWFCPSCVASPPNLEHIMPSEELKEESQAAQNRAAKQSKRSRKSKSAAAELIKQHEEEDEGEDSDEVLPDKKHRLKEDSLITNRGGGGLPQVALPVRAATKLPDELVGMALQAWDIITFFRSKVLPSTWALLHIKWPHIVLHTCRHCQRLSVCLGALGKSSRTSYWGCRCILRCLH